MHQAFSKWSDEQKRLKNMDSSILLRSNLAQLEALKAHVQQLEVDNESLANENEELRQFSLDGYDIAKNV
jgi:regulator of replication initiation timing